jgi:hypothetical protein
MENQTMNFTKKELINLNRTLKIEIEKLKIKIITLEKEVEKLNNYQRGLKDALYYMGGKK